MDHILARLKDALADRGRQETRILAGFLLPGSRPVSLIPHPSHFPLRVIRRSIHP